MHAVALSVLPCNALDILRRVGIMFEHYVVNSRECRVSNTIALESRANRRSFSRDISLRPVRAFGVKRPSQHPAY